MIIIRIDTVNIVECIAADDCQRADRCGSQASRISPRNGSQPFGNRSAGRRVPSVSVRFSAVLRDISFRRGERETWGSADAQVNTTDKVQGYGAGNRSGEANLEGVSSGRMSSVTLLLRLGSTI